MIRVIAIFASLAIIPLQLLAAQPSRDWTEKGNGGDVVVCLNPSENKMYDAYEAVVRHQKFLIFPPTTFPEIEVTASYSGFEDLNAALSIASVILDRSRQQDPALHQKLQSVLSMFFNRVRFVANTNLIDVEDMGIAFIPKDCSLQQLVIQRFPRFPADRLYTIALDYWKTLTLQQKAVAIVHEVLYTVALDSKPTESSEAVRYFNALLLSDTLKELSKEEYHDLTEVVFGPTPLWNKL